MFGLRQKLLFGFGGLLAILFVVSGLGVAVLAQYRGALDKFYYENWRSVEYGQNMADSLDRLNDSVKPIVGPSGSQSSASVSQLLADFDRNLDSENHNITLPGEDRLAQDLTELWRGRNGYRATYLSLLDPATPGAARPEIAGRLAALSPPGQAAGPTHNPLDLDNIK